MSLRFGVVDLAEDRVHESLPMAGLDGLIAWDYEADEIGAPQSVQPLHRLVSLGLPVWYGGGLETVHIAELILGLGCEKVIVSRGFYKTERSPEYYVKRLGSACVPAVESGDSLEIAVSVGAEFGYFREAALAERAFDKIKVVMEGTCGTTMAWAEVLAV